MEILFLLTLVLPFGALNVVSAKDTDYYVAAVVEFSPEVDHSGPLVDSVLNNIRKYEELIAKAKRKGVDIIVFPEAGLMSTGLFEVPRPEDAISPCLKESEFEFPIYRLSCAARKNKIYVAFNIYEKNGAKSHNTNVVFDRNGIVVSRYRKIHFFNEHHFQVPDGKDCGIFHTDFGVTFGVAICFDLLFREPASELVHTRNIRHFVFSSAWYSELPFLTAVQTEAAWAWSHNCVLLASGANNPNTGNTGSGIFAGRMGPVTTLFCDKKTTQLLIGRVPKNLDAKDVEYAARTAAAYKKEMKNAANSFRNVLLFKDDIKQFASELLTAGNAEKDTNLCHGRFCCHFNIRTSEPGESSTSIKHRITYRLVVWSGVREFCSGVKGGVQFCGIVACRDATNIKSCSYPMPANRFGKVEFSKLEIHGNFETTNTMTLANTMNLNLLPLPGDTFDFTKDNARHKTMVLKEKRDDIQTFAIYNRVFAWDIE